MRMAPEHMIKAVVDETSDRPVDELPGLGSLLGPEFTTRFREKLVEVEAILVERTVATLATTMEKTRNARSSGLLDPSQLVYSSGQKLVASLNVRSSCSNSLYVRSADICAYRSRYKSTPYGRWPSAWPLL